jgi:hypothetical protein
MWHGLFKIQLVLFCFSMRKTKRSLETQLAQMRIGNTNKISDAKQYSLYWVFAK